MSVFQNQILGAVANQLPNNIPTAILQGSLIPNSSPLNPNIINVNQLDTLVVGFAAGQVKETTYNLAIQNTNKLYSEIKELQIENNELDPSEARNRGLSILGTKLFDNLIIKPTIFYSFKSELVNGEVQTISEAVQFSGLNLDSCMIQCTKTNTIVQTLPVASKSGSIKEFMSSGEYSISVTAYITAENLTTKRLEYNVPALQQIAILAQCNQAVDIDCYFLQLLGISKVVVTSIDLTQVEGFQGIVQLSLELISDTNIEVSR